MVPRQTISFLKNRMREIGIQPDHRRGQNFLVDLNLLELLSESADLSRDDVVLEVGTGTGSLTGLIAAGAGEVVTVEVDANLHQLAQEILIDTPNITFLLQDALKNKNRFNPIVIDTLTEKLDQAPGRQLKLCANLPYVIATPVLSNMLSLDRLPVSMTATIQKELADRILASPGSKDYSGLSIWMQSQCRCELVRALPPTVFWPRPKVHSAIIHLRPDPILRERIPNPSYFHQFVRAMFIHRRKFLRSNLVSAMKRHLTKDEVDAILDRMQFSHDKRAEQIGVDEMLVFCELVREQAPDWKL